MSREKQIEEMVKVMNECCNRYDEQGNHIGNKCYECEEWSHDNHCCCSYNTKEATALYNAGYRKQSEWISVDERLPDEDGWYITYTNALGKDRGVIAQRLTTTTIRGKRIRRWEWQTRISPWIVTHWMPLPEPPKKGGAE